MKEQFIPEIVNQDICYNDGAHTNRYETNHIAPL